MSKPDKLLPLFPLGVVLFPRSALALHIFEERYKILISLSLEKGVEFGINLTRDGVMSRIGCTAAVRDVVRRYDDGKLDIVVEGGLRYDVLKFHEDKAPYFVGTVEYRGLETEDHDREILEETVGLYNKMMMIVYRDDRFRVQADPGQRQMSYLMAQKAGLDIASRQYLLEEDSESSRLKWLLGYFREVVPKLENAAEIDKIVRNDGYL